MLECEQDRRREVSGTRSGSKSGALEVQIPSPNHFCPKAKKEDSSFDESLVAEMGFEPHDLRVMSPTSYQTAPLRDIMVPEAGIEPVREVNLTGF